MTDRRSPTWTTVGPYGDGRVSGFENAVAAIHAGLRQHASMEQILLGAPWRTSGGSTGAARGLLTAARGAAPGLRQAFPVSRAHPLHSAALIAHVGANTARARQLVRGPQPDALHVHAWNPHAAPFIQAAALANWRVHVTVHAFGMHAAARDLPWRRRHDERIAAWLARHEVPVSFVSSGLRDEAEERFGLHGITIGNGVHLDRFQGDIGAGPWDTVEGPIVVQVGSLNDRKDPLLGIAAWKRAVADGAEGTYVLVGDGPLLAAVESAAGRLGDRVVVAGRVQDDADVAAWMRRADALCLPSTHEGMSLVLLEAMAAGTPIVAWEGLQGLRELGGAAAIDGVLAAQRTADSLGQALASCLSTTWDAARIRRRAEAYAWDAVAGRYAAWLRD